MRCAQCQADAPDSSRFCPSCGRPLEAVTALLESDRTAASGSDSTRPLPWPPRHIASGMRREQFPLGWTVWYKGHAIQVQNHAFLGERLLIDGKVVDRGRVRMNVTLRGTIEGGAGAGERITAETKATFSSFSCRLVGEAFGG